MDTGEGRFIPIDQNTADAVEMLKQRIDKRTIELQPSPSIEKANKLMRQYPKAKGIFHIGEELEIKGSKFKVHDISPFGIKLRLLQD